MACPIVYEPFLVTGVFMGLNLRIGYFLSLLRRRSFCLDPVGKMLLDQSPDFKKECLRLAGMLAPPENMVEEEELFNAIELQAVGLPKQDQRLWLRYAVEAYICRQLLDACQYSLATGYALRFE